MLNVSVELVTRKSKKTGNDFTALEMTFPNGFKKLVFIDYAEQYLIGDMMKDN